LLNGGFEFISGKEFILFTLKRSQKDVLSLSVIIYLQKVYRIVINTKQKKIAILTTFLGCLFLIVFFSNKTLQFLVKDKIWAHKINSIKKLNKASTTYPGVELDVVYYNNYFDVNHPPDKSNNLKLEEYFLSQKTHENRLYWIDFKNLNKSNHINSANKLDSLVKHFTINKKNVIVESTNAFFLKSFFHKGFPTSYYLPINLHLLNKEELKTTIHIIRDNIDSNNNTYISSNYKDYNILKEYFPNQKKLCWFTTIGSMNKFKARLLLYKTALDKNVEVLLIPFH